MASKSTAQQIRKEARRRAVEAAAKHEELARRRFEAELDQQRARAKANEEDLGNYYQAEAAIAEAEEKLATTRRCSTIAMSDAAQAIVAREGSVSAAATLLGVAASRISSLARAANLERTEADAVSTSPPESATETGEFGKAAGARSVDDDSAAPDEVSAQ